MCQSFIICDSIDFLIFQKHFFPTHFFYFSLFSRFFFTILSLICAAIKYLKWVSDCFFALFPGENCSSTSRYITSILCHFAMSHREFMGLWICVLVAVEFFFSCSPNFLLFVFHWLDGNFFVSFSAQFFYFSLLSPKSYHHQ